MRRGKSQLDKINAGFFPVGNMASLINLKKAEHRSNELFMYCFLLLFSLFAPLKSKFTANPRKKNRGKQKLLRKIYYLSVRVKAEIVCHIISLHVSKNNHFCLNPNLQSLANVL